MGFRNLDDIMSTANATLEKKRKELGFNQFGMVNGISIYVSTERANASESEKRVVAPKLRLATCQLLLSGLSSDSSLRGEYVPSVKTQQAKRLREARLRNRL
jgi:hypothetical protein